MALPFRKTTEEANPYAPSYPTIAGDFNDRQYTRGGIQNIQTEMGTPREQKNRRRRVRIEQQQQLAQVTLLEEAQIAEAQEQAAIEQQHSAPTQQPSIQKKRKGSSKMNTVSKLVIKGGISRISVIIAMSWTGLLNTIIFPMGIICLIALGATTIITNIPGGETATEVVLWFLGASEFDIWTFAFICLGIYWFLIFTSFFGAYIQLKLSGANPTSGKASGMKMASLVGALVISAIPGTTFVPWIFIWLFVVELFPNYLYETNYLSVLF
jgi:hypothetical protein